MLLLEILHECMFVILFIHRSHMICLAGIFLGIRLVFTAEKWCASRRTNLHFPHSALVNWRLRIAGPVMLLRDRCVELVPLSGLPCSPSGVFSTRPAFPRLVFVPSDVVSNSTRPVFPCLMYPHDWDNSGGNPTRRSEQLKQT